MEARVGTLPVGTQFDTMLTGRRGVVRAHGASYADGIALETPWDVTVQFTDATAERRVKRLHPDVRVRVVEVTH